jgi:8-oxo-dGTP pyrophosphatase MutT (NUDIX family)
VIAIFKHKVFAYITHENRLLVFRHPDFPAAGIQVPAGTIEQGEQAGAAVMREAREETGLVGLTLVRLLGEQMRDMADFGRDEVHHRYFYHLRCGGNPPEVWRHCEASLSDGGAPVVFEYFWGRLPDGVPALIADHGKLLPELIESLSRES